MFRCQEQKLTIYIYNYIRNLSKGEEIEFFTYLDRTMDLICKYCFDNDIKDRYFITKIFVKIYTDKKGSEKFIECFEKGERHLSY